MSLWRLLPNLVPLREPKKPTLCLPHGESLLLFYPSAGFSLQIKVKVIWSHKIIA